MLLFFHVSGQESRLQFQANIPQNNKNSTIAPKHTKRTRANHPLSKSRKRKPQKNTCREEKTCKQKEAIKTSR